MIKIYSHEIDRDMLHIKNIFTSILLSISFHSPPLNKYIEIIIFVSEPSRFIDVKIDDFSWLEACSECREILFYQSIKKQRTIAIRIKDKSYLIKCIMTAWQMLFLRNSSINHKEITCEMIFLCSFQKTFTFNLPQNQIIIIRRVKKSLTSIFNKKQSHSLSP